MWIETIYINGFGIFNDPGIQGLSQRLNLIVGDNEAGKSTLTAFVKQVFFGFPKKNDAVRKQYPPLRGGNHGGILGVRLTDGSLYSVSRGKGTHGGAVTVKCPDGRIRNESELKRLLGAAAPDMYETIFAFGLDELQNLKHLDNENIGKFISAAGMGISPDRLNGLKSTINNNLGALYVPRGSKGVINVLISEFDEIQNRLKEGEKIIDDYERALEELAEKETLLKQLEERRDGLSKEKRDNELLLRCHEDWFNLKNLTKECEDLPDTPEFSTGDKEQMAKLSHKIETGQREVDDLSRELEDAGSKLKRIEINGAVLEKKPGIEELIEESKHYKKAKEDHSDKTAELRLQKERLNEALHGLGTEWDEERLRNVDISLQAKKQVRSFSDRLTKAEFDRKTRSEELRLAEKSLKNAETEYQNAQKAFGELPPSPFERKEDLEARKELVYTIDGLLRKKTISSEKTESLRARQIDREQEQARLENSGAAARNLPSAAIYIVYALLIAAGVIAYIAGYGIALPAALCAAAVFIAGGVMLSNLWNKRQNTSSEAKRLEQIETLRAATSDIDDEINRHDDIIDAAMRDIRKAAAELDVEPPMDEAAVRMLMKKIDRENDTFREKNEVKRNLDKADSDRKKAAAEYETARDTLKKSEEQYDAASSEWEAWLTNTGLKPGLDPDGVLDIFTEIGKARDSQRSVKDLGNRIGQMAETITDFEEKAGRIARETGLDIPGSALPVDIVSRLKHALEEAAKNTEKKNNLEENLAKTSAKFKQRKKELENAIQQQRELLDAAGVDSVGEFFSVYEQWERRIKTGNEIDRITRWLDQQVGTDGLEWLEENLADTLPVDLEENHERIKSELNDLKKKIDVLNIESGGLLEVVEQHEKRQDTSKLLLDREEKTAAVRENARKWAVNRIAQALLEQAQSKYEKERQPDVIKAAGRYFKDITGGAYVDVFAPSDGGPISVTNKNGESKTAGDPLSKGTAEELYFSVRLGLIADFSAREEPLPVIMDDVFVNMDDNRAPAAVRTIRTLLDTNQVFIFTCHDATARRVHDAFPDVHTVRLASGALVQ